MNIILSGYGRMGKEVEQVCLNRNHRIVAVVDNENDWNRLFSTNYSPAVVIDFSMPNQAISIFKQCFERELPIVTGTTGWYDKFEFIKELCHKKNGSFFYAPNFSIGVNIFFRANSFLAKLMSGVNNYKVHINETHHIHKIDAPSGTAIATANDIINNNKKLIAWSLNDDPNESSLPIYATREGEVTGKHEVIYESNVDKITLGHEAKNRSGFALGAVMAAEFLDGKKGFYSMTELLDELESKN